MATAIERKYTILQAKVGFSWGGNVVTTGTPIEITFSPGSRLTAILQSVPMHLLPGTPLSSGVEITSISGTTTTGYQVSFGKSIISSSSSPPGSGAWLMMVEPLNVEITDAHIATTPAFLDCYFILDNIGFMGSDMRHRMRSLSQVQLDRYLVKLIHEEPPKEAREISRSQIRRVSARRLRSARAAAYDLCRLLTFATGKQSTVSEEILVPAGGHRPWKVIMRGAGAESGNQVPLVPLNFPGSVERYVQQTFPAYRENMKDYRLNVILTLLTLARNHPYKDVGFILASVAMEAFKDSYAKNIKHFPQDKQGFYLKPSGRRWSFRELIRKVFRRHKLRSGGFSFIDIRNHYFHTATHGARKSSLTREHKKLMNQANLLALKIMNYSGQYVPFLEPRIAVL